MIHISSTQAQLTHLLHIARSEGRPKEVLERLEWFLHYGESKSVGATCRHFAIARTTFHRWAARFNPENLSTLENQPLYVPSEQSRAMPAAMDRKENVQEQTTPVTAPEKHVVLFCDCALCRVFQFVHARKRAGVTLLILISITANVMFGMRSMTRTRANALEQEHLSTNDHPLLCPIDSTHE